MAKEWAKWFYNSKAWKICRADYIKSVDGLCERCYKQGRITIGTIVHHLITLTPENINNPAVSLNHKHLELVCQTCHNKINHDDQTKDTSVVRDGLAFDANGDLIQL